jgi:hypothetical protein
VSPRSSIETMTAARYFFYATAINVVVAAIATAPVLDPQLGIPIKISHWPGTWIFVAYFSFLIVGVLGMLAWSVMYAMLPRLFDRSVVRRSLLYGQLLVTEVSVVGATGLMGIFPGYVGGTLIQQGFGEIEVTRVIEWTVIPIGIFISLAVLATLAGVANILLRTAPPTEGPAQFPRTAPIPRSPVVTLILAVVPGFLGIMGVGHFYVGRVRRGAFLLVSGVSLAAAFAWLLRELAPSFTGWALPALIEPGSGEVGGMSFTGVVELFIMTGILLVGLWAWQAYDSYASAAIATTDHPRAFKPADAGPSA